VILVTLVLKHFPLVVISAFGSTLKGGDRFVRTLSAAERFRCLGFPSSGIPNSLSSFDEQFPYLQASGNTFAVPVFVNLLSGYARSLVSGEIPESSPIAFSYLDQASALQVLGQPASNASRQ
jgi:hypothetical protein